MVNPLHAGPAPEIILIAADADQVCCDGGGGALGHPKVWYSFDRRDMVECGYCDRRFVKAGSDKAETDGGHALADRHDADPARN